MFKTVCIFDIDNSKSDFAKAFYFINQIKTRQIEINTWEKHHVSVINNIWLSNNDLQNKNPIKVYITTVEKNFGKRIPINLNPVSIMFEDTLFYFRVKNTSNNDIVNLHYYYLMKKELINQCSMGIITNNLIKERMTASFLIGVKENFMGREIPYQIVKYNTNNKYKLTLIQSKRESVFFLRSKTGSNILLPH